MSSHRLSRYVTVAWVAAAVALLAVYIFSASAAAQGPKPIYEGTQLEELKKPPVMDMPPKWEDSRRDKMVAEFERRLGKFKPVGSNKKKDPDDYYLIATGDVNQVTKSADVRFMVLQGQRKTAEFLVDYIAAAPAGVERKWHVFARFKNEADANEALATARMQYDQMVAYRQQLEQIYRVVSTRRC